MKQLWSSPGRIVLTLLILLAVLPAVIAFVQWGLVHAVFSPNLQLCEQQIGEGACWGVIAQKWPTILFGRMPVEDHWRGALLVVTLTLLLTVTLKGWIQGRPLAWAWLGGLVLCAALMWPVPSARWGGLPLTLIVAVAGFGLAMPLGVLLALGRRSGQFWLARACSVYVELCRALPLLTVLFLAAFVLPLWLPGGGGPLVLRVILIVALFEAAYLAEVMRGGFQSVPAGQAQAARALGFNSIQVQILIVIPQAIRACLPSLMNSFITLLKESSLITVVSLFELTGSLSLALAGDVQWRQFYLEAYLFIALIYWMYCYGLGRASFLEKKMDTQ